MVNLSHVVIDFRLPLTSDHWTDHVLSTNPGVTVFFPSSQYSTYDCYNGIESGTTETEVYPSLITNGSRTVEAITSKWWFVCK